MGRPLLCPGDLIVFNVTGHRLLVIEAREPEVPIDGSLLVTGLMSTSHSCELTELLIDVSGCPRFWNIAHGKQ